MNFWLKMTEQLILESMRRSVLKNFIDKKWFHENKADGQRAQKRIVSGHGYCLAQMNKN